MNILVVKPSSLGDVVHTFPAVQLVRRQFPEACICWVVNEELTGLIELFRAVDDKVVFRRRRLRRIRYWGEAVGLVRQLRGRPYDVALDFQGLFRSGLMARLSGARRRVGFANAREGAALFYSERVPVPPNVRHAVDRNAFLVRSAFGLEGDLVEPELTLTGKCAERAERLIGQHRLAGGDGLLAVAPAARWESKTWPPQFFAGVIDRVMARRPELRCWLLGSGQERQGTAAVAAQCRGSKPANLAGETDLGTVAVLLSRSDALLTNDSGPMHLAAVLKVPTVAMFGPTDPELTGPYGQGHVVFRGACDTGPCFARRCPLQRQVCLDSVGGEHVAQAVLDALHRDGAARAPEVTAVQCEDKDTGS